MNRAKTVFAVLVVALLGVCLLAGCSSGSSSSSKTSQSSSSSTSKNSSNSYSGASKSNPSSSSSNSTSESSQAVENFSPSKTYKKGDIVRFSGYSLGGEQTVDQNTGKKGAVIFFSTNQSSSTENAQAIILLDTVRAINRGSTVQCTAVYATTGENGVPVFSEM